MRNIIAACLLFVSTFSLAQELTFSTTATVGITRPILDNGLGIHIGFNPYWKMAPYFGLEGQGSYAYVRVDDAFLSGEKSSIHTFNALLGIRFYLNSEEKRMRPYVNFLAGGVLNREEEETGGVLKMRTDLGLGYSLGAFLEMERFLIGLSVEAPGNLVLKVGYGF